MHAHFESRGALRTKTSQHGWLTMWWLEVPASRMPSWHAAVMPRHRPPHITPPKTQNSQVPSLHPPLPFRSTTPLRSTSVSSMMPRSALLSSTAARVAATAWWGWKWGPETMVRLVERGGSVASRPGACSEVRSQHWFVPVARPGNCHLPPASSGGSWRRGAYLLVFRVGHVVGEAPICGAGS